MAPTLFNLYASVVFERWPEKVKGSNNIGMLLLRKLEDRLFCRNAREVLLQKEKFADDVKLLARSRAAACDDIMIYILC